MKRILLISAAFLLLSFPLSAQGEKKNAQDAAVAAAQALANTPEEQKAPPKPKYWKKDLTTRVNFNQTSLTNWAAGGANNVTLASFVVANANYAKGKTSWANSLQLDYGFIYQDGRPFIQKNTDRIYFVSTFGRKASDKLNYTAQFTLRTQFTNSYAYATPSSFEGDEPSRRDWMNARKLQSGLFSPAYVQLPIGIQWIPNPNRWLVVNFAPLTGGFTVVADESLRRQYGMKLRKAYRDASVYPYTETKADGTTVDHGEYYRYARFEFGTRLQADLAFKVNNNFTWNSQLVLFSDYLNEPTHVRVNFDNRINWQLAKYLSFSLSSFMIYDHNVLIKNEKDLEKYPNGTQRLQFRELVGFGFSYTFTGK